MTRMALEPVALLRWAFVRHSAVVTCEIRVSGRHAYDVCVVPHSDVSSAVIERYDRSHFALRRHAEIASRFRQAGWALARQSTTAFRNVAS